MFPGGESAIFIPHEPSVERNVTRHLFAKCMVCWVQIIEFSYLGVSFQQSAELTQTKKQTKHTWDLGMSDQSEIFILDSIGQLMFIPIILYIVLIIFV